MESIRVVSVEVGITCHHDQNLENQSEVHQAIALLEMGMASFSQTVKPDKNLIKFIVKHIQPRNNKQ